MAATAPVLGRIFEPLNDEHDYPISRVGGVLPADLTGTLYRIGPGRWDIGRTRLNHLFDGDGMVSQFVFDGRSARFRNRYVRTRQFRQTRRSDRLRRPGVGTPRPGGLLANLGRAPANVANTNVALHAERLLAFWEGGPPHLLDPDTLETHGPYRFDGRLRGLLRAFSAHPKWDPATGEMFNFGEDFSPLPGLHCWKVDRSGRLHRLASVKMLDLPWNHDMGLTADHLVFVLDPYMFDLRALATGRGVMGSLDHRPEKGTRFVLVPRRGGPARIIEHEALVHVHVANAFEDGPDTVVDLVQFADFATLKQDLTDFRSSFTDLPPSRLMRYRITRNGRVIAEELSSAPGEFPQHDWRLSTRKHRFTYMSGRTTPTGTYDSVLKVDGETGSVQAHPMGDDAYVGEPLFVPRSPDSAEDDGWILVVVYSAREHASRLEILDARDLEAASVATLHLDHHLPLGFHGTFTRRVATPDIS
ncbi:carotenoid oxygenase family protein [Actinocorallia sp. API 0066]|uniref:carotenoid oxygenase family protein n=1 Tax=Actinocorallia sp. API 0066 TaxID=2896846 RepID=UPI001E57AC8F|nr:carotenoid oxygenase family protein [Actinocorallia sp. API 0066]MCD0452406.1 carotenoid oxygenase family protein [Actinocorallia sp. API 0066]